MWGWGRRCMGSLCFFPSVFLGTQKCFKKIKSKLKNSNDDLVILLTGANPKDAYKVIEICVFVF